MVAAGDTQWLVDIHDEHGTTLHRLSVLLGAESESGYIVRGALVALSRRGHRLVDPIERVEFVQEQVVHQARSARGSGSLRFPAVADPRQQQVLDALENMPVRSSEIIVVSHYLSTFGPALAGLMRMTVSGANRRLEEALDLMRAAVGDPTPGSLPGVIESLSQEVTAALRATARLVSPPGTQTLKEDLLTRRDVTGARITLWIAIPMLVASLVLGVWVAGANQESSPESSPVPSASPEPSSTAARSLPVRARALPVYYVGRSDGKLYREFRDLASSGDIVRASIEGILAVAPLDPDLRSTWSAGRVVSVELVDHHLTVDLSADAFDGIDTPEQADLAALQVAYTISDLVADPDLRVSFRMDGGRPPEVFAHQGDGVGRQGLEPMPLLWISAPRNQQQMVAGQVLVVGTVKPGVAAPEIVVTNEAGEESFRGNAEPGSQPNADGWRVWTVTVDLAPGTYTVVATGTRTAGEMEAAETTVDTKTITVVG